MPRLTTILVLLAALALAAGCAKTSKAPAEQHEAALAFEVSDDRGAVYLYRTGRAVGAAGTINVEVNGKTAGGTGPGTYFRWELKPGSYTFHSITGEASATVALEVEAGKLYFIQQDARMGLNSGRVSMKEVEEKTGMDNVRTMKKLVSAYVPE